MTEQRLVGKPMSKIGLLNLIDQIRDLIVDGDSWEGLLNWLMPEPGDPAGTYARVEARYRVGNSAGQGGFEIIGDWVDKDGHMIRHVDPRRGLPGEVDPV